MDYVALQSYIDELISQKTPKLSVEQLTAYKESLLLQVTEAINTHLIEMLSAPNQDALDTLLKKEVPEEEVNSFFETHIPTIVEEIKQVLADFKEGYLYEAGTDTVVSPSKPPVAPSA